VRKFFKIHILIILKFQKPFIITLNIIKIKLETKHSKPHQTYNKKLHLAKNN